VLRVGELHEIYDAAVAAGLPACREGLLGGIDPAFVASLPVASSRAEQVLSDLNALNRAGRLEDESAPLEVWLLNASKLSGARREAGVFRRMLELLRGTPPPGSKERTPLRILFVLASPVDLPRFDDAQIWRELAEALGPMGDHGSVVFERLEAPTENALRQRLAQRSWHVLYLVVHGHERRAARYGAIALQGSDGRARHVAARYLADLVASNPSLRAVVLQAGIDAASDFGVVCDALVDQGVTAVVAPPLGGKAQRILISKLATGALAGVSAEGLSSEISTGLNGEGIRMGAVRVVARDPSQLIFPACDPHPSTPTTPVELGSPSREPSSPRAGQASWQETIQRKRASGRFDVFLCHNPADKPAVKRIGQQLKEAGILPWLDSWELQPGQPWQILLERQIGNIQSGAVFVGLAGIGPWQEQEMYGFLRELVTRKIPVIPVLLPDAPSTPELPVLLRGMTWVDFRSGDPAPLDMLIWGITGRRPDGIP
jgi:Effector-associated domain 5/TIR domain